jgi:hypothetical protein
VDPLSDLLRVVRLDGAFFYAVEAAGSWSIDTVAPSASSTCPIIARYDRSSSTTSTVRARRHLACMPRCRDQRQRTPTPGYVWLPRGGNTLGREMVELPLICAALLLEWLSRRFRSQV